MSTRKLQSKKVLVRRQIMNDIHELNLELSGLREILRMKQCMLRKTNQEIYQLSQASSYLELVPGKKDFLGEMDTEQDSEKPTLALIRGGLTA